MSRFLYFAYGSNMLSARLRERTPSARALGPARLDGHALRWHKAAADGSGKCDIVPDASADAGVWGVLYDIALAEKPLLDAAETLGIGYTEKHVDVRAAQGEHRARAYVALLTDAAAVPYDWYKALVVGGAREHALDAAYVAALDAAACKPDTDAERAARHFALSRRVAE